MSRANPPLAETAILIRQIEALPEISRLRACSEGFAAASQETVEAILAEAARFASGVLDTLNADGERHGPRIVEGRVRLSETHRAAWQDFAKGGWLSLDLPEAYGGQGLPLVLAVAVQEVLDRSCCAFGMLSVPTRSAAKLIARWADNATKAEWLAKLVTGEWTATICISEADAGSDAGRMRTMAVPDADGGWRVTGEKNWISFGDHDASERIGHCLLARTQGAKGLSLFLVPDSIEGERNGVVPRRLEEKMGLHLSPTCALGFEASRGVLLGEEGRGLAQMFVMITSMRMAVGAMGLGIASCAADVALAYAQDRRQGGTGPRPIAIIEHPDVQRQLLSTHARVELLRGLIYATAAHADLAECEANPALAAESAALSQWMLPIVKTLGGETAFGVASDALQVLGGAGYTSEWPVEQAVRDARVLPVFEGTTGMQALDLVHRRLLRGDAKGLEAFLRIARDDMSRAAAPQASAAAAAFNELAASADLLISWRDQPNQIEAGATAFLDLAGMAALGWIAIRLSDLKGDDPVTSRLRSLAEFWLHGLGERAAASASAVRLGAKALSAINTLYAPALA